MLYSSKSDREYLNEEGLVKYLPLVESVARRIDINNNNYELDDLINIGFIGLMDAMEKFDEDKKVPFEAYARIRIRGSIIDEMRRMGPVSRNRMDDLKRFYEGKRLLENELMRTPSEEEILESLDIGEKELKTIHETIHFLSSTSLESLIYSQDGQDTELIDMLEDKQTVSPESHFLKEETNEHLAEVIESLDKREQTILDLYYVEELSMKEIAYILDVSIPRISQIHGSILVKMRDRLNPYMEG